MSAAHASPAVITRGAPLTVGAEDDGCISILSWNVLADCYFKQGKGDYSHVPSSSAVWDWPQRCELIVGEIVSCNADVVCLQEVRRRLLQSTPASG